MDNKKPWLVAITEGRSARCKHCKDIEEDGPQFEEGAYCPECQEVYVKLIVDEVEMKDNYDAVVGWFATKEEAEFAKEEVLTLQP